MVAAKLFHEEESREIVLVFLLPPLLICVREMRDSFLFFTDTMRAGVSERMIKLDTSCPHHSLHAFFTAVETCLLHFAAGGGSERTLLKWFLLL